jgi:protein-tyrosine phosphatase
MPTIVAGVIAAEPFGHACPMSAHDGAAVIAPAPRHPSGTYRICLVCLGNICRSPMAEVILRDELGRAGLSGRVEVDSAGTGDWHVGGRMDRGARAELTRRGYDGSRHRARQFDRSWFRRYDLVLAMDDSNLARLRRMAPDREAAERTAMFRSFDPALAARDGAGSDGSDLEVPDPYGGGPEEYALVFDLVLPAARGLADQLRQVLADRSAAPGSPD